jgi:hypothetical protein
MSRVAPPDKLNPLSDHARDVLRRLPLPSSSINPGVADRFLRGGLATVEQLPSPYKKHKGGTCAHLVRTEAGDRELMVLPC